MIKVENVSKKDRWWLQIAMSFTQWNLLAFLILFFALESHIRFPSITTSNPPPELYAILKNSVCLLLFLLNNFSDHNLLA